MVSVIQEFRCRELDRARLLLQRARERKASSTPRVWMKSAMVEREHGDPKGDFMPFHAYAAANMSPQTIHSHFSWATFRLSDSQSPAKSKCKNLLIVP